MRKWASRRDARRWSTTIRDASPETLANFRASLERILVDNILAFWRPRAIDRENGGYSINHDAEGNWTGQGRNRQLVSQARMLWFFARLMNSRYRSAELGAAAQHGFEFLRDRFWDHEHGGFFWEVDSSGRVPIKVAKHLYGQAFGLYALAEYAIATADSGAASMAHELFTLLQRHAHDAANAGYREFFERDWQAAKADSATYMERRADIKQLNTHVHLLEAFTRYHDFVRTPLVRDRVLELVFVMSNAVVRKSVLACTDIHGVDWTPDGDATACVTYGHDLENVWLLIEACDSVELANAPLRELYEGVFHNAWRFGCDHARGGFFYQGPLGGFATARQKTWWVQAEAMLCALHLYRLTRREGYLRSFRDTLDWITNHQIDWRVGEWHRRIEPDGAVSGSKSADNNGGWKCAYHNGRAILRCLELVEAEERRAAAMDGVARQDAAAAPTPVLSAPERPQ